MCKCGLNTHFFQSLYQGTCHKVLEVDDKKSTTAKEVAVDFRIKKISIADIRPETLLEIHKFPFTIQKLIAKEAGAIFKRLQEVPLQVFQPVHVTMPAYSS